MRKATKRTDAEPVEIASKTDASPPKKTKSRAKVTKEPAPIGEARLPRAAKTKTLSAILNNNNVANFTAITKKSKGKNAGLTKASSTEDMSPQSMTVMKKSQSAEDIVPKERKAPTKKGGKVVADKPPKKAASNAKTKLKQFAKEDGVVNLADAEEPEVKEVEEDEEVAPVLPAKKTTGKAAVKKTAVAETKEAPKKRVAKKTTTRGRGKAVVVDEEDEEIEKTEDVAEDVKPAKGRKGKAVGEAKPPPKKQQQRGKKIIPNVELEEKETEADDEATEDVADNEEEPIKEVKPANGKKGKARAAPAKGTRGKKVNPPVVEEKDNEEEKEDEEKEEDAKSEDNEEKEEEKDAESPAHNGKWGLVTDEGSSQSE